MKHLHKDKLKKKAGNGFSFSMKLATIGMVIAVVSTVLGTLSITYYEFRKNKQKEEQYIGKISEIITSNVTEQHGNINWNFIQNSLDIIVKSHQVTYVEIRLSTGVILSSGNNESNSSRARNSHTFYIKDETQNQLGILKLIIPSLRYLGYLQSNLLPILLIAGFWIFLGIMILIIIFNKGLRNTIQQLSDYAKNFVISDSSNPLSLNNKMTFLKERKDLEHVVELLNALRLELKDTVPELRKSEERFEISQQFAAIGSCDFDINEGSMFWSRNLAALLGYHIGEKEPSYENLLAAIEEEDRNEVDAAIQGAIALEKEYQVEYRVKLPDGSERWHFQRGRLYKNSRTDAPNLLSVIQDVTERKNLEIQLRHAQKMEAIGHLTGGIAHDFNNILAIVLGNLEITKRRLSGQTEISKFVDAAHKGCLRGAELTRKLLSFSRKETYGKKLTIVNDFILGMKPLIDKSLADTMHIETALQTDIWAVNIEPGDLEDVILNLSLNARDAMPNGGVLLMETSNKILDDNYILRNPNSLAGEFVMLSFSDTGNGMSASVREKALDPFFSTKQEGKGTGLGLSMVYGFVQRSNGHMKIYSEEGEGTTIRIFIPRANIEENLPEENMDRKPIPTGSEKILVVDDETALLAIAKTMLEELGYHVLVAENGVQALELLSDDADVHLLFTDVIMPKNMDGYELAVEAHKRHPALKILITSGFTKRREEKASRGSNSKFVTELHSSLLSKPYNLEEIAIAVRGALDR